MDWCMRIENMDANIEKKNIQWKFSNNTMSMNISVPKCEMRSAKCAHIHLELNYELTSIRNVSDQWILVIVGFCQWILVWDYIEFRPDSIFVRSICNNYPKAWRDISKAGRISPHCRPNFKILVQVHSHRQIFRNFSCIGNIDWNMYR